MSAEISDAQVEATMADFARTVRAQHAIEGLRIKILGKIKQINDSRSDRIEKSYELTKVESGMRTPKKIEEMEKVGTEAKEHLNSIRVDLHQKEVYAILLTFPQESKNTRTTEERADREHKGAETADRFREGRDCTAGDPASGKEAKVARARGRENTPANA